MVTVGAIVLMGCGRTHAREPDPLPCGGEPLVLGASAAIEEQPAVVVVGGGSRDFVAWRAPETIEVRAIGRHGSVTAATSWERVRSETIWSVGPPQLFLSEDGLDVVYGSDAGVMRALLDRELEVVESAVWVARETTFRAVRVAPGRSLSLLTRNEYHHGALHHEGDVTSTRAGAFDVSFDGTTFLSADVLGHGAWQVDSFDERGDFLRDGFEHSWAISRGDYGAGSNLVPDAWEVGQHAGAFVDSESSVELVVFGGESVRFDVEEADASMVRDGEGYLAVVSGGLLGRRGVHAVEVDSGGRLRAPVEESALLVAGVAPSHPAVAVHAEGVVSLAYVDEGEVRFARVCR